LPGSLFLVGQGDDFARIPVQKVIELMDRVLVDFEEALRMLEGEAQSRIGKSGRTEAYGNIWDVASTCGFLMDSLEEWKAVAKDNPDPEHFKANINMVWDKLNEWTDYPRLSQMALDSLSIPPMSAECKRLFSVAGQTALPLRTRLEAGTIGITQTLRSWVRNSLIDAQDKLIDVSEDMKSSLIWETASYSDDTVN
jgi:hypothetical protein